MHSVLCPMGDLQVAVICLLHTGLLLGLVPE